MKHRFNVKKTVAVVMATVCLLGATTGCGKESTSSGEKDSKSVTITNVSYDPTRELYKEYNELFQKHYKEETGVDVEVVQSHGGSGSQARSVLEGNDADEVTLALAHDITSIEEAGMIEEGWLDEFEGNSSQYTSNIVFVVRSGNEK